MTQTGTMRGRRIAIGLAATAMVAVSGERASRDQTPIARAGAQDVATEVQHGSASGFAALVQQAAPAVVSITCLAGAEPGRATAKHHVRHGCRSSGNRSALASSSTRPA